MVTLSHRALSPKPEFIVGPNLFRHRANTRTCLAMHGPHVSSYLIMFIYFAHGIALLKLSSGFHCSRRLVTPTMNSQELTPDGQFAPLAPTHSSVRQAIIFVPTHVFLLAVLVWLFRQCFCSRTTKSRVVHAAPPYASKTNTNQESHSRPGPVTSEHHDVTPSPEATTRIELLCQQLAAMAIQRDEAVELSKNIANGRDKFKIMFGTAKKEVKDSHVKVRSLNTEITKLLAKAIGAKAQNELLQDDIAADAEVAKAEKKGLRIRSTTCLSKALDCWRLRRLRAYPCANK